MKLREKVNLALSGAFLVGLLVATGGAYKLLIDEALDSSARDARIIMEGASAIRTYTLTEIYPLLDAQLNVQFLPHTVSAYAAQTNFKLMQKKLPEYSYREPALNPTNINDRAVDWEADIINNFRERPDQTELTLIRSTPVGKFLGDAWVLFAAKVTAEEATELMEGRVSWQTAVTAAAGLFLISGVLFIDWRQLLGQKKLRLNFQIWKR